MKCDYGCNNDYKYILKNGKKCCSKYSNQCEMIRIKNSKGLSKAHTDGKLTTKHFKNKEGWSKGKTKMTDIRLSKIGLALDQIFVENSLCKLESIKKYIIQEREYKCEICGISEWNNQYLVLHLDHINGNNKDQRKENLRLICPNCHSQTDTYCGRLKSNKIVSDEEIINTIKETKNIRECLIKIGLVAKGGNYSRIKNILQKYNLSFKK